MTSPRRAKAAGRWCKLSSHVSLGRCRRGRVDLGFSLRFSEASGKLNSEVNKGIADWYEVGGKLKPEVV